MNDNVNILTRFADAYRSGAHGADIDCDSARALAMAIDELTVWRSMETAPKDETPVRLQLKKRIPSDREDLRRWDGIQFIGRHPGVSANGFDIGWQFAAPVGQGGWPDSWFEGWMPL